MSDDPALYWDVMQNKYLSYLCAVLLLGLLVLEAAPHHHGSDEGEQAACVFCKGTAAPLPESSTVLARAVPGLLPVFRLEQSRAAAVTGPQQPRAPPRHS